MITAVVAGTAVFVYYKFFRKNTQSTGSSDGDDEKISFPVQPLPVTAAPVEPTTPAVSATPVVPTVPQAPSPEPDVEIKPFVSIVPTPPN